MEYKLITELAYTYIGLVTTMTKHYVDEGVPLIFNSSIKRDGIDTSKPVFLDREFAEKNKNRKHKKDDVVTVHTGDIGVSAIISNDLDGSLGFATIVTRINDHNVLNPEYLCAFLNYGGGKEQLYKYSRDARNNLNLADYNRLIVPLPKIDKQYEIINIVNKLKNVIASRKQELQILDDLIKARFVELFGDQESNPFGWEQCSIGECCTLKSGTSLPAEVENEGGSIPYVKVGDMNYPGNERYITTSSRYVSEETAGKGLFEVGSIIFPKRGGAIGTNKKRMSKLPICADLNVMGVSSNGQLLPEYLLAYFDMIDLGALSDGSSVPQINNKNIAPLVICVPPMDLQKQFAAFVEQTDKSKVAIQKALDEAQLLFDSLMQKYFG